MDLRPKVLKALRAPPQLQPGDSFLPIADCIGEVAEAYLEYLSDCAEPVLTHYLSDPCDRGAVERKYQLSWCTALARAIGEGFGCSSAVLPTRNQAIFYGEELGARCAGALYAHAVSEIDRYSSSEYLRRYKRATYHGNRPQYGWRKSFIREGINHVRSRVGEVHRRAEDQRPTLPGRLRGINEWAEKTAKVVA